MHPITIAFLCHFHSLAQVGRFLRHLGLSNHLIGYILYLLTHVYHCF